MRDIHIKVISCQQCVFDMLVEDDPSQENAALKPLMHGHDDYQELVVYQ